METIFKNFSFEDVDYLYSILNFKHTKREFGGEQGFEKLIRLIQIEQLLRSSTEDVSLVNERIQKFQKEIEELEKVDDDENDSEDKPTVSGMFLQAPESYYKDRFYDNPNFKFKFPIIPIVKFRPTSKMVIRFIYKPYSIFEYLNLSMTKKVYAEFSTFDSSVICNHILAAWAFDREDNKLKIIEFPYLLFSKVASTAHKLGLELGKHKDGDWELIGDGSNISVKFLKQVPFTFPEKRMFRELIDNDYVDNKAFEQIYPRTDIRKVIDILKG